MRKEPTANWVGVFVAVVSSDGGLKRLRRRMAAFAGCKGTSKRAVDEETGGDTKIEDYATRKPERTGWCRRRKRSKEREEVEKCSERRRKETPPTRENVIASRYSECGRCRRDNTGSALVGNWGVGKVGGWSVAQISRFGGKNDWVRDRVGKAHFFCYFFGVLPFFLVFAPFFTPGTCLRNNLLIFRASLPRA